MKKNTKKEGLLRFFIYFDKKENEFIGVCLELGIIKCGDNPYFIEKDLREAAIGYVDAVRKENLSDDLLNQKPPKEYLDVFNEISKAISSREEISKKTNIDLDEEKSPKTFILNILNVQNLCPASC